MEGFRPHIGFENIAPAAFQLAVACFGKEGEGLQLIKLVALTGVIGFGGGFLVFQLSADAFHHHLRFGTDGCLFFLKFFNFLVFFSFQVFFQIFHVVFDHFLDLGYVLGANFLTSCNDHLLAAIHIKGDRLVGGFPGLFLELALQALAFFDHRLKKAGDLLVVLIGNRFNLRVQVFQVAVAQFFVLSDLAVDLLDELAFGETDLIIQAFQRLLAGVLIHVGNDVLGKVKHAVQVAARDIQQQTQIRGNAPGIPDMRHRGGQVNMAHTLAAYGRAGNFNTALVTNNSLVTGVLIFSAVTLPIPGRSKDRFAEETIFFRP